MTGAEIFAVSGPDLIEGIISGLALGARYALIALGFVVVFRATGVVNFANGAFVLFGGYMTYQFSQEWEINFYLSILLAMVSGFLLGVLVETIILGKLMDAQPFTVVMVTIGLLYIMDNLILGIWGGAPLRLGDPWTGSSFQLGDVETSHRNLWAMGLTASVLAGFMLLFRFTKVGLAMRATALDAEAAQAQGIRSRSVHLITWGIAGTVAALAGVMFTAGSQSLEIGVGLLALAAFPAMILGGLESPLGAVVGGIIIGLVQQLTQLLAPDALGRSPGQAAPYLVMLIILMVRPYGLFGTKEVRRA